MASLQCSGELAHIATMSRPPARATNSSTRTPARKRSVVDDGVARHAA